MPTLDQIFQAIAALAAGGAAASGWNVGVIGANVLYDGLDAGRADRVLRKLMVSSATFQAVLLVIAASFSILSQSVAAFVTAILAALGFFSNVWTLSPRKDKALPGARRKNSTRRVVAVALTLMMTSVAFAAAVLAVMGI